MPLTLADNPARPRKAVFSPRPRSLRPRESSARAPHWWLTLAEEECRRSLAKTQEGWRSPRHIDEARTGEESKELKRERGRKRKKNQSKERKKGRKKKGSDQEKRHDNPRKRRKMSSSSAPPSTKLLFGSFLTSPRRWSSLKYWAYWALGSPDCSSVYDHRRKSEQKSNSELPQNEYNNTYSKT